MVIIWAVFTIYMHELSHIAAGEYMGYNMSDIKLTWTTAYVYADEYDYVNYTEQRELAMYQTQGMIDGVSCLFMPFGLFIIFMLAVMTFKVMGDRYETDNNQ